MPYDVQQLSDMEDIRQCALRYCRGVDRLDPEIMRSAYWQDATDDHGAFRGNAWEFVDHCMTAHLRWRSTHHCVLNHAIELDSDGTHARGEIYNVTYLFHADDSLDTWHGRYLDLYEKRQGEWRILNRICVHEGTHHSGTVPMEIDAAAFTQGDFDRGISRPLGP